MSFGVPLIDSAIQQRDAGMTEETVRTCHSRAIGHGQWTAGLCAQFIAARPLLDGTDPPWLDAWRRRLDETFDRALEAYAAACLGFGGTELPAAAQAARRRLERNPLRETGTAGSCRL